MLPGLGRLSLRPARRTNADAGVPPLLEEVAAPDAANVQEPEEGEEDEWEAVSDGTFRRYEASEPAITPETPADEEQRLRFRNALMKKTRAMGEVNKAKREEERAHARLRLEQSNVLGALTWGWKRHHEDLASEEEAALQKAKAALEVAHRAVVLADQALRQAIQAMERLDATRAQQMKQRLNEVERKWARQARHQKQIILLQLPVAFWLESRWPCC